MRSVPICWHFWHLRRSQIRNFSPRVHSRRYVVRVRASHHPKRLVLERSSKFEHELVSLHLIRSIHPREPSAHERDVFEFAGSIFLFSFKLCVFLSLGLPHLRPYRRYVRGEEYKNESQKSESERDRGDTSSQRRLRLRLRRRHHHFGLHLDFCLLCCLFFSLRFLFCLFDR